MTRSSLRTLRRSAPVAAGLLSAVLLAAGPAGSAATALQAVPSPSPPGSPGSDLVSVAAVSAADAWAVGYANVGTTTFQGAPLAEHFDGTRWSITATAPVPAGDDVRLALVAFRGASDGWAVGTDASPATGNALSVIEHFDGTSWTRLPSPAGEPFRARLASVTAVSATDAWAVGSGGNTPLIEHWNGSTWSIVPGPAVSGHLYSITALSGSHRGRLMSPRAERRRCAHCDADGRSRSVRGGAPRFLGESALVRAVIARRQIIVQVVRFFL